MNLTRNLKQTGYRLILGVLLTCLSWQVQAACTFFDGFKDNKDGTVTDPRNGLIWKRCAEGFEWNENTCRGIIKSITWFEAMEAAKQSKFLGKADWRIPTKAEYLAVMGKFSDCKANDDKKGEYAASKNIAHDTNQANDPGYFWSSSPYLGNALNVWYVRFNDGGVDTDNRNSTTYVRLVRSSQSSSGEAALEFKTEYAKISEYKQKTAQLKSEKKLEAAKHELSARNNSQSRGGVKDIYRFENGSLRVACNNGNAEVIQKMDTGGWYFSGRVYKEISLLTSAACP